jgi:hypothetical protein
VQPNLVAAAQPVLRDHLVEVVGQLAARTS